MERKKKYMSNNRFVIRPNHAMDVVPHVHGSAFGHRFERGHRDVHRWGHGLHKKHRQG